MHLITPAQCRAARALLNWSQPDLAGRCGVHVQTISNFEQDTGSPTQKTLKMIKQALESSGIDFTADGGVNPAHHIVRVLEGPDAYLQLLDDVLWSIRGKCELLKSGADERKSPKEVIEKNRVLRSAGISMRSLVACDNTYLMGALDEYRHLPPELSEIGDIKLIYGHRVAYSMPWVDIPKVIIIHDPVIAAEQAKAFEYIWAQSTQAKLTTSKIRY